MIGNRNNSELIGFWQLATAEDNYLVTLERSEKESAIKVFRRKHDDWAVIREIRTEEDESRAIDGFALGNELFLCTEMNSNQALQVVSTDYLQFVDPAVDAAQFSFQADFDLLPAQVARVELPVHRMWNSIQLLPINAWLFSPRFVRGATTSAQIVANTADGRIAILTYMDDGVKSELLEIDNALLPQAFIQDGEQIVAFRQMPEAVYPFWVLPSYSGTNTPLPGELVLHSAQGETDLSAILKIGPIIDFALVGDRTGAPWIFALRHRDKTGAEVLAITRREGEWVIRGTHTVDASVGKISVERGQDSWHLLSLSSDREGWTLTHQDWSLSE